VSRMNRARQACPPAGDLGQMVTVYRRHRVGTFVAGPGCAFTWSAASPEEVPRTMNAPRGKLLWPSPGTYRHLRE